MRLVVILTDFETDNELIFPVEYFSKEDFENDFIIAAVKSYTTGQRFFDLAGCRWTNYELFPIQNEFKYKQPVILTIDEWYNGVQEVKKVCPHKIEGSCPLHNLYCQYPECEQ